LQRESQALEALSANLHNVNLVRGWSAHGIDHPIPTELSSSLSTDLNLENGMCDGFGHEHEVKAYQLDHFWLVFYRNPKPMAVFHFASAAPLHEALACVDNSPVLENLREVGLEFLDQGHRIRIITPDTFASNKKAVKRLRVRLSFEDDLEKKVSFGGESKDSAKHRF
jgi:hypothetical protein